VCFCVSVICSGFMVSTLFCRNFNKKYNTKYYPFFENASKMSVRRYCIPQYLYWFITSVIACVTQSNLKIYLSLFFFCQKSFGNQKFWTTNILVSKTFSCYGGGGQNFFTNSVWEGQTISTHRRMINIF